MRRAPSILAVSLAMLSLNSSQPLSPSDVDLQRELQSLTERGLDVKVSNDVVEATDPLSGRKWLFSMGRLRPRVPAYGALPALTIDLRTIDTSLYNWRFRYESSFPMTSYWGFPLQGGDFDHDGWFEVYGVFQTQGGWRTRVFELADSGWAYRFTYPTDSGIPDKSGDLDLNGLHEVYTRYGDSLYGWEQSSIAGLPIARKFRSRQWYYDATGIPNQIYDIDNDFRPEILFQGSEPDSIPTTSIRKTYAGRYDSTAESLVRIWSSQLPAGCIAFNCAAAIACGDFDGDSRGEFVTSAEDGGAFVVEHVAQDSFRVTWTDSVQTGWRAAAGDVDANGWVEFFVGGSQLESDGYVHLRVYAFESTGDNTYAPFLVLDIFPTSLFFVDLFHTSDVDGDGFPELILSFSGGPLVLKGNGPHAYEIFYYTAARYLDAASAMAIGDESAAHLFISRFIASMDTITWTDVYRLDSSLVASVAPSPSVENSLLLETFPNPFNGSTIIRYTLQRWSQVRLVVYDLIGREIAVLVESEQSAGMHTVAWTPGESAEGLAAGLYICRLTAGNHSTSKKLLYLK